MNRMPIDMGKAAVKSVAMEIDPRVVWIVAMWPLAGSLARLVVRLAGPCLPGDLGCG